MSDWVLAIDFGTTSTAAAIRIEDRVQLVALEGAPQMPSAVFWREGTVGAHGELVLGRRVENLAARAPWCLERTPKRRIADEAMQLGDQQVRVTDAIAEILRKVAAEATRLRGGQRPTEVRLTHPARWGEVRLEKLRRAAAEAGFLDPVLIPEPVAAATYFASLRLGPGEHVAVYDLGGGTFDTAVLCRTDDGGFEVVGRPGGREDLGGEDFDDLLYRHLGAQLPPDDWRALRRAAANRETAGNTWREANLALQREARLAKEVLSDSPDYEVRIPVPVDAYLPVAADELARLIRPDLEETVAELERTIASAGLEPADLAAIYLAGGSSRIPLVSELIKERLGQSPDYLEDPKAVIALGAARPPIGSRTPTRPAPEPPTAPLPDPPPEPPTAPAPDPPPAPPTASLPDPPPTLRPVAPPPPPSPPVAVTEPATTRPTTEDRSQATPTTPAPIPSARAPRSRLPAVVLAAVAVVAIAVVVVVLAAGGSNPKPGNRAAQVAALNRLDGILAVAAQGRAAIQANNFNGAIANRRAVLVLLDRLGPVPPDLVAAVRALRRAEEASLNYDTLAASCGVACSQRANANATAFKAQFAALFNPVAIRFGAPVFSPDEI